MFGATMLTVGTGAVVDTLTRRVPNRLALFTAALGLGLSALGVTHVSFAASLGGFALGLAVMLPGHLVGATGAGDVKLMAAAGTILGVRLVPVAFLYTLIAGGVLACMVAVTRGRLPRTLRGIGLIVVSPHAGRRAVEAAGPVNRFPYAPAIAGGCLLAALGF
jgi:prepilin peptidase CpaA